MKKIASILLITLTIVEISFGQADQRLLKYWYYKKRLHENFMLGIGRQPGFSLIGNERTIADPHLHYGDVTINSAYYLCFLAIEYKLLLDKGYYEEADRALNELYYAIEAFNRLDYVAEEAWGKSPYLNGFFIRDDVGKDLVPVLPYYQAGNAAVNTPQYIDAISRLNNSYRVVPINHIQSDWLDFYQRS